MSYSKRSTLDKIFGPKHPTYRLKTPFTIQGSRLSIYNTFKKPEDRKVEIAKRQFIKQ